MGVKTMMRSETEKACRAARELSTIVYQSPGMQMKLIKEFASMTHQKEVTIEMIHAALLRLGHSFDLEDVERAVSFFIWSLRMRRESSRQSMMRFMRSVGSMCRRS